MSHESRLLSGKRKKHDDDSSSSDSERDSRSVPQSPAPKIARRDSTGPRPQFYTAGASAGGVTAGTEVPCFR